jgi:hypothetical protein
MQGLRMMLDNHIWKKPKKLYVKAMFEMRRARQRTAAAFAIPKIFRGFLM